MENIERSWANFHLKCKRDGSIWCKIKILCDLIEQTRNIVFLFSKLCHHYFVTSSRLKCRFCHNFVFFFRDTMFNTKFPRDTRSLEMPFFKDHSWDLSFLIKSPKVCPRYLSKCHHFGLVITLFCWCIESED